MINQKIINADTIQSVVEHMNDDHADACLRIVQTLGDKPTALAASMTGMDESGVDFSARVSDSENQQVRVVFDKAVSEESQIRARIVALAKRAKLIQNGSDF